MINKLQNLNYKPASEFTNKELKSRVDFFIKDRITILGTTYYAKILETTIEYSSDNGDSFQNTISIIAYFLINEQEQDVYDYFCTVARPFDIRTEDDFEALEELFRIFRNDVEKMMMNDYVLS